MKVAQLCPTLYHPMDYTVLQARILEWVAVPFFRGSSQPRDQTQVSCIAVDSLPAEPPGKTLPGLGSMENILLGGRGSLPPSAVNYFPSSSCSSRPSQNPAHPLRIQIQSQPPSLPPNPIFHFFKSLPASNTMLTHPTPPPP